MNEQDVQILEKTEAFKGYFRIDRYRLRHRLFRGGWSGEMTREVFERGHAAAVLPYDPVADAVVLIEQFRIGAFAAGKEPWLVEVVAGIIEKGETAEDVVRREAVEEAGCQVHELIPIADALVSPGATSECIYIFCGRVDSAGVGGYHGQEHEHEDIRVTVVPFAEILPMLEQRKVDNATALISMQWLLINRERVRKAWSAAR
jgi:ADP-ribose pyrophosphatase